MNKEKVIGKYDEMQEILNHQTDGLILIIRVHLLLENYLDQLILLYLKNGQVITNTQISFSTNIKIVSALGVVPEKYMNSITGLNKVRNKCAHDMYYEITFKEIDCIGNSLGADYQKLKNENRIDFKKITDTGLQQYDLLRRTIYFLLGAMDATLELHTEEKNKSKLIS